MFPSNKRYAIQHIVTENGIGIGGLTLCCTIQNNLWDYYNLSTHAWQGSPYIITLTSMTTGDFGGNGGYYRFINPDTDPEFFVENEHYFIRVYHDDPAPLVDFGFYDTCVAPTAEAVSTAAIYNDMAKEASTQAAIAGVAEDAELARQHLDNDRVQLQTNGETVQNLYDDNGAQFDGDGVPQGTVLKQKVLKAFGHQAIPDMSGTTSPAEAYTEVPN